MNRIIKFRAWTKRDKCWCGAFAVHMSGLWRESPNNEWTDLSKQDEIELMQFTGFLDKNGKEIYVGDIVEIDGDITRSNPKHLPNRDVMEFINGQFLPRPHGEQFEIIGNVFENPELLTL